jgi:hypothetical protein
MACYMIACELNRPGDDYIDLVEAIERLDTRWRPCLEGMWLVVTEKSAAEIRDELRAYLGPNDQLFVAQLSGEVAWRHPDRRDSAALGALFRPQA